MKVIYVYSPVQNEHTKRPQVIDGKVVHWLLRSECLKIGETLHEFLERKKEYAANRGYEGIFFNDAIPLITVDGQAGLIIRYRWFKKEIWE